MRKITINPHFSLLVPAILNNAVHSDGGITDYWGVVPSNSFRSAPAIDVYLCIWWRLRECGNQDFNVPYFQQPLLNLVQEQGIKNGCD
jgi:hypothetical protein